MLLLGREGGGDCTCLENYETKAIECKWEGERLVCTIVTALSVSTLMANFKFTLP